MMNRERKAVGCFHMSCVVKRGMRIWANDSLGEGRNEESSSRSWRPTTIVREKEKTKENHFGVYKRKLGFSI